MTGDNQGGARTPHCVRVRSACQDLPARGAAASCAALAYSDRGVFACGGTRGTLLELAAGRVQQLPSAPCVSGTLDDSVDHGESCRRPHGDQSLRFLHRGLGRGLRLRLPRRTARRPRDISPTGWGHRGGVRRGAGASRHRGVRGRAQADIADTHHRLPRRAQSGRPRRRRVHRPTRARRADAGVHTRQRHRLVPRLRVAPGGAPARAGIGGALCLRLPGAAHVRHQVARRSVGTKRRFHRSTRMDRGLSAGRWLGGHGPDVGSVRGGGPHPARRDADPRRCCADQRRNRSVPRDPRLLQHGHPLPRGSAGHPALYGVAVGAGRRTRCRGRQEDGRQRRPTHDGW